MSEARPAALALAIGFHAALALLLFILGLALAFAPGAATSGLDLGEDASAPLRSVLRMLGGLAVGVALLLGLLAWGLHRGWRAAWWGALVAGSAFTLAALPGLARLDPSAILVAVGATFDVAALLHPKVRARFLG